MSEWNSISPKENKDYMVTLARMCELESENREKEIKEDDPRVRCVRELGETIEGLHSHPLLTEVRVDYIEECFGERLVNYGLDGSPVNPDEFLLGLAEAAAGLYEAATAANASRADALLAEAHATYARENA